MFLADIIRTSDGEDGTNFYVRNGVVGTVEMPGNRFVALIVFYITQIFSKPAT